ncbi:serine/threonine-protein kinase sck1 [Xylariaceae sp. FL0594]|nr:serine/threonine-protein kinase sck1 [Xylariaceae sp. FL0594]
MAEINRLLHRDHRVSPTDDEGDQIGYDTPRSGIATPQPDLKDKRLPGIMSYFGQVRCTPSTLPSTRVRPSTQARDTETPCPPSLQEEKDQEKIPGQSYGLGMERISSGEPMASPLLPHEMVESSEPAHSPHQAASFFHSYPTPPCSKTPSERGQKSSDASADSGHAASTSLSARPSMSGPAKSSFDALSHKIRRPTLASPVTTIVTTGSHPSSSGTVAAPPTSSPPLCPEAPQAGRVTPPSETAVVDKLRKLTLNPPIKSGLSTPTRALSVAHSSPAGDRSPSQHSRNGAELEGRQSSATSRSGGVQAPPQRGKLTIKIREGRGLRRSRDPYVVAVFQRNELISHGPRTFEDEDEGTPPATGHPMGGIPISRQGSDSGRPMAIPMRSRQSSNTSTSDFAAFRNRTRRSFTSPKWDAEAVFDVVDSDMLVDISVYDHSSTGEEFLGHVDFQATVPGRDEPVRGWFPLRGNADTTADKEPTGEIYVEAIYQSTEKKHYGPDDFQILRLIGKGTFGQVYQVRKKDTHRIYAMKVLSKKVIVQKKEVAHTVGERNILVRTATSESPFIVGLKFSFQTDSDLFLVTDYMSGGELFWHLQKEGRFDEKRAKFYIAELILAIQHLHHNDIVYRDLKPENILLDANGHIALCDFGLSKANLTKNDTTNTFCGTTEYLAPEVLLDESGYTKMVDFWSLGVLVFEMCCGWSPFYAEDTQQMYKNIAFGKVRFPRDTLSQEGRNFVKGLLNRNPKHRLGAVDDAEELKRHAFFADIDWDSLSKKLITPPFKPKLKSETDVSYFDPEFTNALNTNGSLNERAQQLAAGYTASTPLSPTTQANFKGFTYVDESALDDHMRGRYADEMSDNDEQSEDRQDNDWDDLGDFDLRRGNGTNGGAKISHQTDEPFQQFDL